jgi:hypothetical protein
MARRSRIRRVCWKERARPGRDADLAALDNLIEATYMDIRARLAE